MIEDDDVLIVVEDETAPPAPDQRLTWKVAVIDDDPAVHDGTRFALYDYSLAGYGIQLLSAYSAEQGRQLMLDNPDIAVVLLDVVMESDRAGLDLVNIIRRELKNETVRIILRTGQPGQAPEREVIVDYDINDYKAKTELTSAKLFTSLTAALRSYQQLKRMEETRRGLEIIIDAASTLYDFRSVQRLAEGVLTQIASLLGLDCAGILVLREGERPEIGYSVLAGSGCYSDLVGAQGPGSPRHPDAGPHRPRLQRTQDRLPRRLHAALCRHRERHRSRGAARFGQAAERHRPVPDRHLLQPLLAQPRQCGALRALAGGEPDAGAQGRGPHRGAERREPASA